MCEQNRTGSEDWDMEQNDGLGMGIGSLTQVIDVPLRAEAADDGGAWRCDDGVPLVANGDLAVVADADAGLLAPDVGLPETLGDGADDGAVFGEGLLVGGLGCLAQFAVDFILVAVRDEWVEPKVGPEDLDDPVGGQEGDEAFLPVVVAAFDFAFGLGRGGIEQRDAVEVEGRAEWGEGVGGVGVAEGVEVHIQGQGQAVGLEDTGTEVEMSAEGFAGVKPRPGVEARGVIQDVQQHLLVGVAGQPGVGRGVVWPEGAVVAGLPAFDGLGWGFVAGVGSELMREGPAADAGPVGLEAEAAMEFAGDAVAGGGRFGGEEFGDQVGRCGGPVRVVIAAGEAGRPGFSVAVSAGQQVVSAQLVEASPADAQFEGDGFGWEEAGAGLGEEMADEGRGHTEGELVRELRCFMARS